MVKFLHLADVHLDTTFLCRTASLRTKLRDALRKSYERAVDCAIDERVHAVLIAGDLFDNDRLSFATERFLVEQCRRLDAAGIPCFYATGNHDPGGPRFRGGRIEWPDSFHFIGSQEPSSFVLKDTGGRSVAKLVGIGHAAAREERNLARLFPPADDGMPHIGLLHTFVTSATQAQSHDRYAPCSLEDLRRPGYRYWALGHIHRRQQVCDISEAWYPGNLQGRNPKETGPKGGMLVSLDDNIRPNIEFRSFAPVHWLELRLGQLDSTFTFEDLERHARRAFDAERSADADDWLVRVILEGPCPLADELRTEDARLELEELLTSSLGAADVEVRLRHVTRPMDIARYRGEPHVLGAVLELVDEIEGNDELLASTAPDVLAGGPDEPGERLAYLRGLLSDLDAEAAARLVRHKS